MSPVSSYFISLYRAALQSQMITAGSQGHYQETRRAEPKTFGTRQNALPSKDLSKK